MMLEVVAAVLSDLTPIVAVTKVVVEVPDVAQVEDSR